MSGSKSSATRKGSYWRPCIPAHLGRNIGERHLDFNLKQSDRRQPGYMVRKLSLMMFEITENPRSTVMAKESL